MAISRVKPGGWATYEQLTSTQLNSLDTNFTYVLDKRSGQTDTLESDVSVTGDLDISGDVTIRNNLTFDTAAGTGNIVLSSSEVRLSTSASIFVASGGTIKMATSSQIPVFDAAQTFTRQIVPFMPLSNRVIGGTTEWAPGTSINASVGTYLVNTQTDSVFSIDVTPWVGATLTNVSVYYKVEYSHFPTSKLSAKLTKFLLSNPSTASDIVAGTASGADAASYFNGGVVQTLSLTASEVMTESYRYILTIFCDSDISGAGLYGATATYSASNIGPK